MLGIRMAMQRSIGSNISSLWHNILVVTSDLMVGPVFISKNLNVSFIKRVSDTTLQLGLDLSAYPFFHLLLIRTLVYLIDNWDKQLTQDWFFHPGPQMGSFDLNLNTLNKTHKYHHITCNIKSSNRPPRTPPVTLISQMRMARVLIIANDKTFLQPDPQTMNKGYKI